MLREPKVHEYFDGFQFVGREKRKLLELIAERAPSRRSRDESHSEAYLNKDWIVC